MAKTDSPIRILIADDHPIFRDGLYRLLQSEREFQVVGEARDGIEAVRMAAELKPDILLLDVAMPRVTGLDALQDLREKAVSVKTILLTAAIDKADIVTALQLGARGVVLKEVATLLLFKCIKAVVSGQYWVGRQSVTDLRATIDELTAGDEDGHSKETYGLTKREFEIIGAIVSGLSNRNIAQKFSISEDTVKHHLTSIFNKLNVSTRLELALFAVNKKLLDSADN